MHFALPIMFKKQFYLLRDSLNLYDDEEYFNSIRTNYVWCFKDLLSLIHRYKDFFKTGRECCYELRVVFYQK